MHLREQIASTINEALHRLPLVLEILEEIHEMKGPMRAGDDDLRHGSMRAVRSMVERLGRMTPAPATQTANPTEAEKIAAEWLIGDLPARLIPSNLLDQLSSSISHLLPQAGSMNRSGQAS